MEKILEIDEVIKSVPFFETDKFLVKPKMREYQD
jgi:hypothetical protein